MDLAKLMKLSEAAGFVGGSVDVVDAYPEMSLDECMTALPIFIMESQIEGYDAVAEHNNTLCECLINQAESGAMDESAMFELSEKGLGNVASAIKNFFTRLKGFIDSIIAKLKTYIDRAFASGKTLVKKYANDPDLKNTAKLSGLTLKGELFAKESLSAKYVEDIQGLMSTVYGDDVADPKKALNVITNVVGHAKPEKEVEVGEGEDAEKKQVEAKANAQNDAAAAKLNELLEKMGDMSNKEAASKLASAVSGVSDLGEDWKGDLRKKLYLGDHEFKYGSEGFDLKSVVDVLSNPADTVKIKTEYEKLKANIKSYETELTQQVDRYFSGQKFNDRASTYNSAVGSALNTYFTKYLSILQNSTAVLNGVQNIRINFEQAKYNQAKRMFSAMIGAAKKGEKKSKEEKGAEAEGAATEAADLDDTLIFEI